MICNRECNGCHHYSIDSYLGVNIKDSCSDCPSIKSNDYDKCSHCNKEKTIPCFNERGGICWYEQQKIDYMNSDYGIEFIGPIPEVKELSKRQMLINGLEKAKKVLTAFENNWSQYNDIIPRQQEVINEVHYDYSGYPIRVVWPGSEEEAESMAHSLQFNLFPSEPVFDKNDEARGAYPRDAGYTSAWDMIQKYLEDRNERPESTPVDLRLDYSVQLALKRSTSMVGYTVDDEGRATIDIHSLAMTPDEATGRSGTKNHARRIRVSAGFVEVKSVKVSKYDEPIDIIRKLEQEQFAQLEECYVKVTNIGTNPYTHEAVRTPSRPIDYNRITVNGSKIEDALAPIRDFYGQFDMHKHNYVGTVNKKSDGRCPRTGSYPEPKSEDMLKLYRHQPAIIITPNVQIQETTHTVKFKQFGALQQELEIAKVTRGEDCECGCNVKVKDMRRGEVICPKCGLVFHRDTIVG